MVRREEEERRSGHKRPGGDSPRGRWEMRESEKKGIKAKKKEVNI